MQTECCYATERSGARLACLLARCAGRAALLCIKRVFIEGRKVSFCRQNLSRHVHSNHNLHQTAGGRERRCCGQHASAWQDPTARKTESLAAHDDAMDLNHHPFQRAQGSKRELVARGPRGGEERHDEPEGVEE